MKNHKNLIVWKKSHALVRSLYRLTAGFPNAKQHDLISRIRSVATSKPDNIVERCSRFSQAEFAGFLQIFPGSSQDSLVIKVRNDTSFTKI